MVGKTGVNVLRTGDHTMTGFIIAVLLTSAAKTIGGLKFLFCPIILKQNNFSSQIHEKDMILIWNS